MDRLTGDSNGSSQFFLGETMLLTKFPDPVFIISSKVVFTLLL